MCGRVFRNRKLWFFAVVAAFMLCIGVVDARVSTALAATAAGDLYQDMPVGFTAAGDPFRGNHQASVTLVEYTDYLCPFCQSHFKQTVPTLIEKYGRTGLVKFVVRDLPLASIHPTAPKGAEAARCVAEQGATKFWQMHDLLFQGQQQWSRLPDPAVFLADVSRKAGANATGYEECMASGRNAVRIRDSVAAAEARGFTGTPTFEFVDERSGKTYTLVGAQPVEVFANWIDLLLAGKEPPRPKEREKPELPLWAKPEGLAPDPKRPGFTIAGDMYKGSPTARLIIVEFGDFQCPSCRRHALETQPALDKKFVETGDIRWVVKHFPLSVHRRAPLAAAASECAGEQGKFWPMHDLLFERMEQWVETDDPETALVALATSLRLDAQRFMSCLSGRQALERVLRGLYDGQAVGVRNLPTFFIFDTSTPRMLVGARAAEQFSAILEEQLRLATTPVSPAAEAAEASPEAKR